MRSGRRAKSQSDEEVLGRLAGAKAAPLGALLVFFMVRMGRYLSSHGEPPEGDLVAAYLALLEALSNLAAMETPLPGSPQLVGNTTSLQHGLNRPCCKTEELSSSACCLLHQAPCTS